MVGASSSTILSLSIDDTETFFKLLVVPVFSFKALALISKDTWSADGMAAIVKSSLVYASFVVSNCSNFKNVPIMLFWNGN